MVDERSGDCQGRTVKARFENCEMRRYRLAWQDDTLRQAGKIVLTEVDLG